MGLFPKKRYPQPENFLFILPAVGIPALAPFFWGANTTGFGNIFMAFAAFTVFFYFLKTRTLSVSVGYENQFYFLIGAAAVVYVFLQACFGALLNQKNIAEGAVFSSFSFGALRPYAAFEFGFFLLTNLLWFLFINIQAKKKYFTDYFLKILYLSIFLHAFYAIFLHINGIERILWEEKTAYSGYATGGFVNRNAFALYCLIGFAIGVYFLSKRLKRVFDHAGSDFRTQIVFLSQEIFGFSGLMIVSLLTIMTALLLSGSRVGAFLLLTILFFRFARLLFVRQSFAFSTRSTLAVASLCMMFVIFVYISFIGEAVFSRLHFFKGSFSERLDVYKVALDAFFTRPVFGYGSGAFEDLFNLYQSADLVRGDLKIWDKAHNSFLEILTALGFAGGFVFLGLCGFIIYRACEIAFKKNRYQEFGLCFLTISVMIFFQSLFDFSLQIPANSFIYTSLTAIALAKTQTVFNVTLKKVDPYGFGLQTKYT